MALTEETCDRLGTALAGVFRTAKQLNHRLTPQLDGATPFVVALLAHLVRTDEQRLSALACSAHVDPSVISRQVATLERLGLVERRTDPEDRRAALLRATHSGRRVVEQTAAARARWLQVALNAWSDEDARLLLELLDRMDHDLSRLIDAPPSTTDEGHPTDEGDPAGEKLSAPSSP